MKHVALLTLLVASAAAASASMIRVPGSMYDISAPRIDRREWAWPKEEEWEVKYLDDVESLSLGPLDGQVNEYNEYVETWSSLNATVEVEFLPHPNQFISQTNTAANDYFEVEISTTLPDTFSPFVFGVESTLSDLNTNRFYAPVDDYKDQIFTRVGDFDDDDYWEVLQLHPEGYPYFAETYSAIPDSNSFVLEILIDGPALEVFVDGNSIFTGYVIDTTPLGGPGLSSVLTSANFESANNSDGFGSVATYDNITIAVPEPASLMFLVLGGAITLGNVLKRLA